MLTYPLSEPIAIVAALLAVTALIFLAADSRYGRGLFKYVPPMFFIYFLPMVLATIGALPGEKAAGGATYGVIRTYCLPGCLVLLLLSVDIKAIARLGGPALGVMLAGSMGILIGGPIVLLIFKPFVPAAIQGRIWQGFGSLSASWIGGSANMIAVRDGLGAKGDVYSPMVVVDTICPYAWMSIMILLSRFQGRYDRWNHASEEIVQHLRKRAQEAQNTTSLPVTLTHICSMLALATGGAWLSLLVGGLLPDWLNQTAWSLILATGIGVALSFTRVRKLEDYGASRLGYALLYLVLGAIGATTTLRDLQAAPVLLLAGFTWIIIHAIFIIGAARLFRAPMSLMAAASQANIGGPASAPVLAEVYMPGLAPVGLLLAVLGNIIGTYMGFICAAMCKIVNGW